MAKKPRKTVTKKRPAPKKSAAKTAAQSKSAAKRRTTKRAVPAVAAAPVRTGPRRLKLGSYQSLRLQKRIKHPVRIMNVWRLTKTAAFILWDNKKLFIGITLVYGLLNLILVQGFANDADVATLKQQLNQVFTGNFGVVASSVSIFAVLVGSAGNSSNPTAGAYQVLLALIGSLAVIWALRQVLAGRKLRIRDPYYRGMYPLIPFVLVIMVIGLQLIPLLIGMTLYSLVTATGIAAFFIEKLVWALFAGCLALLSLYMLSSSLFAMYIVTLPNMTPMKALRSARQLVRYRRWTVLRKIFFLPIILAVVAGIVMVPIIIWLTPLSQWVFFLLTMFVLVAVHTYMYSLYRELLNE